MPGYDRNLILVFLDGSDAPDLNAQARALQAKSESGGRPAAIASVRFDRDTSSFEAAELTPLRKAIGELTTESRLYLLGKGDWRLRTLGMASAEQVADLLGAARLRDVKTLSIVSDALGRDVQPLESDVVPEISDSFAAQLHRRLRERYNVCTTVHARVSRVVVSTDPATLGRKRTANAEDELDSPTEGHHRQHSKLRFFWKDGRQERDWAY